jgi:hypothetical protein
MELGKIVDNVERAMNAVMTDRSQARFDTAAQLEYLTRSLQIAYQAYEGVYLILLRLSLLTEQDCVPMRLEQINSRLDAIDIVSHQCDADVVQQRLGALHAERHVVLKPLVEHLPHACDWHVVLSAIDSRDSQIVKDIRIAADFARKWVTKVKHDPTELAELHSSVCRVLVALRPVLEKTQRLCNKAMGLSSGPVIHQAPAPAKRPAAQPRQPAAINARRYPELNIT